MSKDDEKATKTDESTKSKEEELQAAARKFWDRHRVIETDQPQTTQRSSMRM
jgi:hypothetical protein